MTTNTNATPGATQTKTTTPPGATLPEPDIDRDALARRIFDAVICAPNSDLPAALADWLSVIDGIAGYLRMTADPCPGNRHQLDLNAYAPEISTLGDAIVKAAGVVRILADEIAKPERQAHSARIRAHYGIKGAA